MSIVLLLQEDEVKGDWATIGVLDSVSHKSSQKGSSYANGRLWDLKGSSTFLNDCLVLL